MTIKLFGVWIRKYSRILALIFAVLISVLIYIYRDQLVLFQGYGLIGLFIISLLGTSTIIVPVPVFVAAFVAGAVFNPLAVALTVSVGSAVGELTGYMAGYGTEEVIGKKTRFKVIKKWMNKYGLLAIFALAAIPNPLFDLTGIVAGATGVPIRKFLVAVCLGKFLRFLVIAYLGANSVDLIGRFI